MSEIVDIKRPKPEKNQRLGITITVVVIVIVVPLIAILISNFQSNEEEEVSKKSKKESNEYVEDFHHRLTLKQGQEKTVKIYKQNTHHNAGEYIDCFEWKTNGSEWMDCNIHIEIPMGTHATYRRKSTCTHPEKHTLQVWN